MSTTSNVVKTGYLKGMVDDIQWSFDRSVVQGIVAEMILDSESKTTPVFAGSMDYAPRKMPTTRAIFRHWAETMVKIEKFDSYYEMAEDGGETICWACGMSKTYTLERAHILPRVYGGTDDVSNLHMLCGLCHKMSEDLYGKEYWDWFVNPNQSPVTYRYLLGRYEDKYKKVPRGEDPVVDMMHDAYSKMVGEAA